MFWSRGACTILCGAPALIHSMAYGTPRESRQYSTRRVAARDGGSGVWFGSVEATSFGIVTIDDTNGRGGAHPCRYPRPSGGFGLFVTGIT